MNLCLACRRRLAESLAAGRYELQPQAGCAVWTGVVHVTGGYDEAEAVELIRAQHAERGFLPALWPETWSYTLSQIWQAGLEVVAFDLGAPAERIRATRRGSVLPFGLPPAATCRALLAHRIGGEATPAEPIGRREPAAVA